MLDCYIQGSVSRISPEAPVPVLSHGDTHVRLGGAANVALGVATLGAQVQLVGVVGADAQAERLRVLLGQSGVAAAGIVTDSSRCTTVKTRVVASHQQIVRIDEEVSRAVSDSIERCLLDAIDEALPNCDALVISDYAKGVCTASLTEAAIYAARALGKPVIVDPKRSDYSAYRGATVITPNLRELHEATSSRGRDVASIVAAALELSEQVQASILVTRSEDGMTLQELGKPAEHLPARTRDVSDVSGAGDTVVATLAVMLACHAPLPQAVSLANVAAGIAVSKHGTYAVKLTELQEAMREPDEYRDLLAPVLELEDLSMLAAQWRHAGLSIGFTNGCFDIIHPGHVKLLCEAASLCDRLIVAVNSDESVRRLKGPTRPINDELSRCTVLSMLRGVAAVVSFDQDTPLQAIVALQPDVLIKGGDYSLETIVGAKEVMARGGRVHIARTLDGHSTTAIAQRALSGGQHA